jgi:hypothetical protein
MSAPRKTVRAKPHWPRGRMRARAGGAGRAGARGRAPQGANPGRDWGLIRPCARVNKHGPCKPQERLSMGWLVRLGRRMARTRGHRPEGVAGRGGRPPKAIRRRPASLDFGGRLEQWFGGNGSSWRPRLAARSASSFPSTSPWRQADPAVRPARPALRCRSAARGGARRMRHSGLTVSRSVRARAAPPLPGPRDDS